MRYIALAVLLVLSAASPIALQVGGTPPADAKTLPSEIPLFPLPNVVLFPGASRPLMIFEPRYREMIADALKGNRVIGTVLLRPGFEKEYEGRPPIYDVGCAGVITEYEQLPDGRYLILLRGLTTFRVLGEDQSKAYRVARTQAIPEMLTKEDLAPLGTLRERITQLLYTSLPLGAAPPDPGLEDVEFVSLTAQYLTMAEEERQNLLERNGPLARARVLVERLSPR